MDYWLGAKRIRLSNGIQDENTSDEEDDSRSNTPDSMLFRDLQNPNELNRCMVGINDYVDPTENNIMQWQEIQLARCITENTVNHVVETYINMFTDDSIRLQQSTIQMAIRMAINEHGLQQTEESNPTSPPPRPESAAHSADTDPIVSTSSSSSQGESSSSADRNPITTPPTIEPPKALSIAYPPLDYDDDDELHAVEDFEYDDFSDANSEPDHSNFLEAAVAAAIQKKGLSSAAHSSSTSG